MVRRARHGIDLMCVCGVLAASAAHVSESVDVTCCCVCHTRRASGLVLHELLVEECMCMNGMKKRTQFVLGTELN